ncbi:hypothetical protein IWW34DRAFT_727927 [Fusarium oxysporum f. sp. albedinis]|nr:hypothetical protein IWW34DRAFT_727927 [Fusarium oxysporum f. sp. albedinis]
MAKFYTLSKILARPSSQRLSKWSKLLLGVEVARSRVAQRLLPFCTVFDFASFTFFLSGFIINLYVVLSDCGRDVAVFGFAMSNSRLVPYRTSCRRTTTGLFGVFSPAHDIYLRSLYLRLAASCLLTTTNVLAVYDFGSFIKYLYGLRRRMRYHHTNKFACNEHYRPEVGQ